jgi:hypothetical protein
VTVSLRPVVIVRVRLGVESLTGARPARRRRAPSQSVRSAVTGTETEAAAAATVIMMMPVTVTRDNDRDIYHHDDHRDWH